MLTVSVFQGKDSRRQKIEQQLRRLQWNYKGISVKIEWGEQRNPFQTGECQKEEPKMWCSHFLWHTSSVIYQSYSVRYTHIQKAMQSLIFKVIKYNTSDLNSTWILLSKCYSSQVNLRASPFYAGQIEHVDGKWETLQFQANSRFKQSLLFETNEWSFLYRNDISSSHLCFFWLLWIHLTFLLGSITPQLQVCNDKGKLQSCV